MNNLEIQLLTKLPEDFEKLRSEAEKEGHLFLNKMKKNWLSGENTFSSPGEMLLGAFIDGELIGLCGRNRDPYIENETFGRIRHLYVLPAFRRYGVGKLLMKFIMNDSKKYFKILRLRTQNDLASKFYISLGFSLSEGIEEETHHFLTQN